MVMMDGGFWNDKPFNNAKHNKKQNGFGTVCRSYYLDPSCPKLCAHSPKKDGYYRATPFWKIQYEIGPAASLGYGMRFGNAPGFGDGVSPDTYDVKLDFAKKNCCYKNISLHKQFETSEAKEKQKTGPGPAKYNPQLRSTAAVTMKWRHPDSKLFVVEANKPGPDAYDTIRAPGAHSYNIKFNGRPKDVGVSSFNKKPGPGAYDPPGIFDKYDICVIPPSKDKKKGQHGAKMPNQQQLSSREKRDRERNVKFGQLQEGWEENGSMEKVREAAEEDVDRVVEGFFDGVQRKVDLSGPGRSGSYSDNFDEAPSKSSSARSRGSRVSRDQKVDPLAMYKY